MHFDEIPESCPDNRISNFPAWLGPAHIFIFNVSFKACPPHDIIGFSGQFQPDRSPPGRWTSRVFWPAPTGAMTIAARLMDHRPSIRRPVNLKCQHAQCQWLATATTTAARQACISRRPHRCESSSSRFESMLACNIDQGERIWERARCWMQPQRRTADAAKTHRVHRTCGTNDTQSPCTAAACCCSVVCFSCIVGID